MKTVTAICGNAGGRENSLLSAPEARLSAAMEPHPPAKTVATEKPFGSLFTLSHDPPAGSGAKAPI
jgi:hypothetical protein